MVTIITSVISAVALIAVACIETFSAKRQKNAEERREQKDIEREKARQENELFMIKLSYASLSLGEATAQAVQRIPDAHCNGEMHSALEYAQKVKHEHKDFLNEQRVKQLYEEV
jgi:hypothetical protein